MKNTFGIMTTRLSGVLLIIGLIVLVSVIGVNDITVSETALLIAYFTGVFIVEIRRGKKMQEMEQRLAVSDTLVQCITTLSDKENTEEAIDHLLQIIGEHFGSDRAYIFEVNYEKQLINNTYEYAKAGISKEIGNLQNIPLSAVKAWMDVFHKKGILVVNSMDADLDSDWKDYPILSDQDIHSLIAAPIIENKVIIGFLGIDNPTKNLNNATLISSTIYFLMDSMKKRSTQDLLERLSFEDALTKMYNRNKYNTVIEQLQKKKPSSLGIVYFDLNGLKVMNDKYGHKAGDILIKNAAACIHIVFGDSAFRIGGDEFVTIVTEVTETEFNDLLQRVRELLKKDDVSVSVGTSWRGADNDITLQMHEADERMYENKKKYYKS